MVTADVLFPAEATLGLVLGTLLVATLFGLLWQSRQGRVRAPGRTAALPEPVLHRVDSATAVTLLQLSSPLCGRCPHARAVLGELADATPGVRHAQIDLGEHPQLADELGVRSTPTTLVLSRSGQELFRVAGVPRRAELLSALQPHL
ncbi:MAG: thioredoxin family protein [Pseudonocardiaceae bacterium]